MTFTLLQQYAFKITLQTISLKPKQSASRFEDCFCLSCLPWLVNEMFYAVKVFTIAHRCHSRFQTGNWNLSLILLRRVILPIFYIASFVKHLVHELVKNNQASFDDFLPVILYMNRWLIPLQAAWHADLRARCSCLQKIWYWDMDACKRILGRGNGDHI